MYKLFDRVALVIDVPRHGLRKGAVGTVVELYPATDGVEVEFFDSDGETIAVATLDAADVRKPTTADLLSS
jgi:hypothetical protein